MDKENTIDISNRDRGDKTIEQLEAELTPEALAMVDQLEANTIREHEETQRKEKKARRHFNKRNRRAWNRMNRPHRLKMAELGMQRIYNLIAGQGFRTDAQIPEESEMEVPKETEAMKGQPESYMETT